LPGTGPRTTFGSGASLQLLAQSADTVPPLSASAASTDPKQIIKSAKTIYIHSKTAFLTVDTLDHALRQQKDGRIWA